ncbi:MAG: FHA domain-containing protein [Kofleriaceae bacterium]
MRRLYLDYLGDSIELPRGETLVGREVGCALRFNDASVSRRHLRFVRRLDEAFVEDLGSVNGTLLNGRAVSGSLRLHDGDVITIGSRVLTIRVIENEEMLPSTLVLHDAALLDEDADTDVSPMDVAPARRPTSRVPRVTPPQIANQRCPKCAAPVRDTDPSCASCGYRWNVRPHVATLIPLDRRRHDRVPMELRLIYVSAALELEATTLDLSHSGVFVRTEILEPVGTHCQLTILIDGGPPLQLDGVVRRVVERNTRGEPVGLGVELGDLAESARSWIDIAVTRITA